MLMNYVSQKSIGSKLRAKRVVPLLKMIESVFNEHGSVDIIDVGGTKQYWNIVPQKFLEEINRVRVIDFSSPIELKGSVTTENHS
jgi:hypothetical protein